jgi:aldehyde dehydrogenase (NAD+)
MVSNLRSVFNSGKTKDVEWRRTQLKAIKAMVAENHEDITAAVRADLGGPKLRGVAEVGAAISAQEALDDLDHWVSPSKVKTPMQVSPTGFGKSYIRPEPKGVVLVIGPWNFPSELVLHPLVSAVAAGNCVVIKPSEVAANTARVLTTLIEKYLDPDCFRVVNGAVAETTALLKEQWDHIFYTGNGHVGRIVLKAAAEHLTPVTLELGGKSPVFIDKSAKIDTAIQRISMAKWLNCGQICVAPDYVMVHKDLEQQFISGMKKQIEKAFGKDPKASPFWAKIINSNHVHRISGLLKETQGEVVAGGMETVDADACYIPPTIVRGAKMGEPLLKEEIFGPVLPVVAVNDMDEAIQTANSICDRPLALYVYSEDKQATEQILGNTLSGGVAINTSLEHLMNPNLPFGGVGGSGYGAYHGKAGFDEFTHKRSVLHQDTTIMKGASLPDQPKDEMYDMIIKFTITGFLTEEQRKQLKMACTAGAALVAGLMIRSRL